MDFLKKYPELLMGMLQLQIKRMREMNELEEKLSKSYLKITRQKQEIETQHEAIKYQKTQLEAQNKSLEELNNQKKQLLSIIIHGLKNPMTSVRAMAEMIDSSDQLVPEISEYASIMLHAVGRMDNVINDLIRTNQAQEMLQDKTQQRLNLPDVLIQISDENSQILKHKKIKVSVPKNNPDLNHNHTSVQLMLEQLFNWMIVFADENQSIEFTFGDSDNFVIYTEFVPAKQLHSYLKIDSLSWWQLAIIAEEGEDFERLNYLKILFRQAGAVIHWSFNSNRLKISITLS
jgi:signal transduction histidine kinase